MRLVSLAQLLPSILLFSYALAAKSSGQIPIRDGVIGGVGKTPALEADRPLELNENLSPLVTPGALRVVENSGVCETTPGVYQASGYGDLSATESIFFWYFSSRSPNASAPLTLWFNGGIFFKDPRFASLATHDLAIWTESYGGHYGPTFAAYFLQQNKAIAAGTVKGLTLNLKTLGIGDGLTDPITQYPGYLTYAASNPYHPLVSATTISAATKEYNTATTGCKARITACNAGGSNAVCSAAQSTCNNNILSPLVGNFDVYYILSGSNDPYPPDISSFLASVRTKVGAEVTWAETNNNVYNNFAATGDWMRSSLPNLETVINAGVRVTIYGGDADYILNFNGIENMIASMNNQFSAQINAQAFKPFTVKGC
ncbi:unnamed protein product [Mycena citricolor]|uniref:Carboxypeptidase n=1 Tax=Mycena citricolor TaxID=2018698 RepID=A0AAD2K724_9AGAR|nr:unnamed protein product [Mycena citricolor]